MISLNSGLRVYLATGVTDMRKSIDTLAVLAEQGRPVSLGELASLLPPAHDLETFALWLAMAREAGIEVLTEERQLVELVDEDEQRWRFNLPYVGLDHEALKDIDWEL